MTKFFRFLNFSGSLFMLLLLFVLINFLGIRYQQRWDVSEQKLGSISGQTQSVLETLEEPVEITVLFQPGVEFYPMLKDLLRSYTAAQPAVRVAFVDPDRDVARTNRIAQQFEINEANVVIVHTEKKTIILNQTDLVELDYSAMQFGEMPSLQAWKAESALTSALLQVTQDESPQAWIIEGHEEQQLDDETVNGLSNLKTRFTNQNIEARSANLLRDTIDENLDLVIIPGPKRPFVIAELQALGDFIEHGGRLLVLLDPLTDTGLEGWLDQWGIVLIDDVVVDPSSQIPFLEATNLVITTYSEHPIVRKMRSLFTFFPIARSVRVRTDRPEGWEADAIALTTEKGWGETTPANSTYRFDPGADIKGPVPIAVALHHVDSGARIVVVGNAGFISNQQASQAGNADFFMGTVHWLLAQEGLIGIEPKPFEAIDISLNEAQVKKLLPAFLGVLPLLYLVAGFIVWRRRRS